MFELRNSVAHRGLAPTNQQALQSVNSAEEVNAWLDGLGT
jgi:hypothetical protein